jgi:hypothetical protein
MYRWSNNINKTAPRIFPTALMSKPAAKPQKKPATKRNLLSAEEEENPKVSDVHMFGPLISTHTDLCITLSRDPSSLPLTEEGQIGLLEHLKIKKCLASSWIPSEVQMLTSRANTLGLAATFHPVVNKWRISAEDSWFTAEQFIRRIEKFRKTLLGL